MADGRGNDYSYYNDADYQIPQPSYDSANPGQTESPIDIPESEQYIIKDISVFVGIKHPYIGDLVVAVVPPWAQSQDDAVILHNREGGDSDDIYKTYDTTTTPALANFIGHKPAGHWRLVAQDWARHLDQPSAGYIDKWVINIHGNYVPDQPTVDIIPDSPGGDDMLVANVVGDDRDGDSLTYEYHWFRNGNEVGYLTGNTVPDSETVVGDTWRCVVVASDGEDRSQPAYDQVVIGNNAPTAAEIELLPARPRTGDNITLNIKKDSIDPDGGTVVYFINWLINGQPLSDYTNASWIPAELTRKGDTVGCVLLARDSAGAYGPPASANVTIANTPPENVDSFTPVITSDTRPEFSWYGAWDADRDPLYYWISLGTSPGQDDTVAWTFIPNSNSWSPTTRLNNGLYFFNIITTDGEDNSTMNTYEVTINSTTETSVPPPVENLYPNATAEVSPLIYWDPVPYMEPLTYHLRVGSRSGANDIMGWTTTEETEMHLEGLGYGTYYIQIKSSWDGLESPVREFVLSVYSEANTPPSAPQAIYANGSSLPCTVVGEVDTISWSSAMDPDGDNLTYSLKVGEYPGDDSTYDIEGITGNEYKLQQPLSTGIYWVSLRAHDGTQPGPWLIAMLNITHPNHKPTPPVLYGPELASTEDAVIWWFGAWDPDGDTLEYSLTIYFQGNLLIKEATTDTEYIPTVPFAPGDYTVRISASDGALSSDEVEFGMTISEDAVTPPAVEDLRPNRTSSTTPEITWRPSFYPGPLTYNISVYEGGIPGEWRSLDRTSYTLSELDYGTYTVAVYATYGSVNGKPAVTELIVEPSNHPPTAPEMLLPYETSDTELGVHWLPSYDPDGDTLTYHVRIGHTPDDILDEGNTTGITYSTGTPMDEGTYYVEVKAWDGASYSEEAVLWCTLSPTAKDTQPPEYFYPGETEDYTPLLMWYSREDAESYMLFVGTSAYRDDILPLTTTHEPEFQLESPLAAGTYYVHIASVNGDYTSSFALFTMTVGDNSPPDMPALDYEWIGSTDNSFIEWSPAVDPDGDTVYYSLAIGSEPYATDISDWKDMGIRNNITLQLDKGTYYVMIRATDGKAWSPIALGVLTVKERPTTPIFSAAIVNERPVYVYTPGENLTITVEFRSLAEWPLEVTITNETSNGVAVVSPTRIHLDAGEIKNLTLKVLIPPEGSFYSITLTLHFRNGSYEASIPIELRRNDSASEASTETEAAPIEMNYYILVVFVIVLVMAAVVFFIFLRNKPEDSGKETAVIRPDSVIKPKSPAKASAQRRPPRRRKVEVEEVVDAEIVYDPSKKRK